MKKVFLLTIIFSFLLAMPKDAKAQTCPFTPPTNTGTATLSTTTTAGTYRIWSRMKAKDAVNNKFYIRVDSNCAEPVGDSPAISATNWTWVDYRNNNTAAKINVVLTSGNHVVTIIGGEPGVAVDKILLTKNLSCVPTGTGDNCPSEVATPTPTPSRAPTPTPTRVLTPTPTPTVTPSRAPTPTPTPADTFLRFSNLKLHGIGTGGDNRNPTGAGNPNPLTTTKTLKVELFDDSGALKLSVNGNVTYTSATGDFQGSIKLPGTLTEGRYLIKASTSKYLRKQLTGTVEVKKGTTNQTPPTSLITGDINGDQKLDILDFNILKGCYSDILEAVDCTDLKKVASDISDDGNVNGDDLTLFQREASVRAGD